MKCGFSRQMHGRSLAGNSGSCVEEGRGGWGLIFIFHPFEHFELFFFYHVHVLLPIPKIKLQTKHNLPRRDAEWAPDSFCAREAQGKAGPAK